MAFVDLSLQHCEIGVEVVDGDADWGGCGHGWILYLCEGFEEQGCGLGDVACAEGEEHIARVGGGG